MTLTVRRVVTGHDKNGHAIVAIDETAKNVTQDLYVANDLKTGHVMVKDEDVCLHCGLCAERCPTYAWDMRRFVLKLPYAGQRTVIPLMAV